jgi:hypothetical protein
VPKHRFKKYERSQTPLAFRIGSEESVRSRLAALLPKWFSPQYTKIAKLLINRELTEDEVYQNELCSLEKIEAARADRRAEKHGFKKRDS